jgi:mannose-6-phosphate isomerase-like protein (cupin superfamily)
MPVYGHQGDIMKIQDTFAVLRPDLSVTTLPVTPTIHAELGARFHGFKSHVLISAYEFTTDWGVWERHPAGDEVVVLLSGRATMVLRVGSTDESTELVEPGSFVVVPRNVWHTARVTLPTRMLFCTPGEGTENRVDI